MTFTSMSGFEAGERANRPVRLWHIALILVGFLVCLEIANLVVKAEINAGRQQDFQGHYRPDYGAYDSELARNVGPAVMAHISNVQQFTASIHAAGKAYCLGRYEHRSENDIRATVSADVRGVTKTMNDAQRDALGASVSRAAGADLCP